MTKHDKLKGTNLGVVSSIFLAGLDSDNHGWMGFANEVANGVAEGGWSNPAGRGYLHGYWVNSVRDYH